MVFALDNSWSIADYYFRDEVEFAKKLAFSFAPIKTGRSHVGVIRFSTIAHTSLDLNTDGAFAENVRNTLEKSMFVPVGNLGKLTQTEEALSNAIFMFRAVRKERLVGVKALDLSPPITSGCSMCATSATYEATATGFYLHWQRIL